MVGLTLLASLGAWHAPEAATASSTSPTATPLRTLAGRTDTGNDTVVLGENFYFYAFSYEAGAKRLVQYECFSTGCGAIFTQVLTPAGVDQGRYVSGVMSLDDNARLAFYDATNKALVLIVCSNICQSSTSRVLDSTGDAGRFTSIALDPSGRPVIAYQAGNPGQLRLYRCADTTCSSGSSEVVDSTPGVGSHTSLAIRGDGAALIAYEDPTANSVRLATCSSATCASAQISVVAADAQRPSMRLDIDDNPVVALQQVSDGRLGIARCATVQCLSYAEVALETGNGSGGDPSLVLDSAGRPNISYYDAASADLKLYQCGSATCSSGTTRTLDSAGDVGTSSRLTLLGSQPLILFHSNTESALRYTWCDNSTCTSAKHFAISDGPLTLHTGMATRADGRPIVAYTVDYQNNSELWVLSCADVSCAGGTRTRVLQFYNFGEAPPRVVVRPGDLPAVYVATLNQGQLIDCFNSDCTDWVQRPIIPPSGYADDTMSGAAVRTDGRVVLAYAVLGSPAPVLYVCGNLHCTSGINVTPPGNPDASTMILQRASLALDASNLPVLSYVSQGNGVQEYVHSMLRCATPGCTTSTTTELRRSSMQIATAAAVPTSGLPTIVESNNGSTRLIGCVDAACTSTASSTLPIASTHIVSDLRYRAGGLPLIAYGDGMTMGAIACEDATCTASDEVMSATLDYPVAAPGLGLDAFERPMLVTIEQQVADVVLAGPPPDGVFSDDFE